MQFEQYDLMNDMVTYSLPDGRYIRFTGHDVRRYGIRTLLEQQGIKPSTERDPVFQDGRQIGTLPSDFNPLFIRSTNFFYDPRPNDFRRTERGWEAANQLGPGDLDAIPDFRWADAEHEAGKAARNSESNEILRDAVFASVDGRRMAETENTGSVPQGTTSAVPSEASADAPPSAPSPQTPQGGDS